MLAANGLPLPVTLAISSRLATDTEAGDDLLDEREAADVDAGAGRDGALHLVEASVGRVGGKRGDALLDKRVAADVDAGAGRDGALHLVEVSASGGVCGVEQCRGGVVRWRAAGGRFSPLVLEREKARLARLPSASRLLYLWRRLSTVCA